MRRMLAVCLTASLFVGCGDSKPKLMEPSELATTPSSQADQISVKVERDGTDAAGAVLMKVTVGENLNRGLRDNLAISDWNGAKVYLVLNCDGRESQSVVEYPNDVDPVTRKNIVLFRTKPTCNGEAKLRLRASAWGSTELREFTFPDGRHTLSPGFRLSVDSTSSGSHVYVVGTPR